MKEEISSRLSTLREVMHASGFDAVIIPQNDPHMSEYLSPHWQLRRYLSGFTGSAGSLVVTADKALLWTDSRYFLQAAQQLDGTEIILMKEGLPGVPDITKWLCDNLSGGKTVGIDGMLFSVNQFDEMQKALTAHGIKLSSGFTADKKLWPARPALPDSKAFIHLPEYAGETAKDKIAKTLAGVKEALADSMFVSALDEIAWLLNIRGNDVTYNPVVTSFLYLSPEGSTLIVDPAKIEPEVKEYLATQGVSLADYADVKNFLTAIEPARRVLIDPARTAAEVKEILGNRIVATGSPVAMLKACKNEIQINGIRNAMRRDGVAMVKSIMEIEDRMTRGEHTTELDVAAILRKNRMTGELYFEESFGTIAGYGPHGAIVHYEATPESASVLEPKGLLLIDSGAQYQDGTTDITRTISLGPNTDQERRDFTLVMKGHIALAMMKFPEGTCGMQLDAIARQYLWKEGLSYMHGTGHGVGHFLNVHEGPQSIRLNYMPAPLTPGMITSNEPGLYRENLHGIRCENLVLCKVAETTEFGTFLCFETLTLCPFDLRLFDTAIMTDEEIEWVNNYHRHVFDSLRPLLDETAGEWLALKTRPLTR